MIVFVIILQRRVLSHQLLPTKRRRYLKVVDLANFTRYWIINVNLTHLYLVILLYFDIKIGRATTLSFSYKLTSRKQY